MFWPLLIMSQLAPLLVGPVVASGASEEPLSFLPSVPTACFLAATAASISSLMRFEASACQYTWALR